MLEIFDIVANSEWNKRIIIAKWKTMEEAIEFAQKIFWFKWNYLEKAEWDNDAWIGIMNQSDYYLNVTEILES